MKVSCDSGIVELNTFLRFHEARRSSARRCTPGSVIVYVHETGRCAGRSLAGCAIPWNVATDSVAWTGTTSIGIGATSSGGTASIRSACTSGAGDRNGAATCGATSVIRTVPTATSPVVRRGRRIGVASCLCHIVPGIAVPLGGSNA